MNDLKIKEIVYQAVQATKNENSGLLRKFDSQIAVLQTHFEETKAMLERIEQQTTKTNGRVSSLESKLVVLAAIIATILFLNGSELISFIMKII